MNQEHAGSPLRVALVQFKPAKADVQGNLARVREIVAARAAAADLVVFPEAALSGYFLEGGVAEAALAAEQLAERLGTPAQDAPDVVVGFYERWRRQLYNSAAYLEPVRGGWSVRHVHRKLFLPSYGVFDEARFVEPGADVRAFDTRFGRLGMLVCEDAWHSLPGAILALDGAEVLVVVSASPARDFSARSGGRPANLERWERVGPETAVEHGVFVVVAQLTGSEGGKLFPGGSIAVGPDGRVLARGPLLEEAVMVVALDGAEIERARAASPMLSDLQQMLPHLRRSLERTGNGAAALGVEPTEAGHTEGAEGAVAPVREPATDRVAPVGEPAPGAVSFGGPGLVGRGGPAGVDPGLLDPRALELDLDLVERTLVEFIREEVCRRRGFERVVLGVSGGVDSAVSLFLACRALGRANVQGFRLPYRTSSPESLGHAALALEATGAGRHTIDISEPIDRYVAEYEPDISPLRKGNLMARLRAVILFDQSAKLGALPLGTGNKSERLLGYFTWHADDSPPINPLGDLFKTQVWALARHLGVPDVIVEKPATADLVRGVDDEHELGVSYHDADPILHWMVRGYAAEELVRAGFGRDAVEVVRRRLDSTHWKRELPTVAVLSSSAIGEFYLRPVDY